MPMTESATIAGLGPELFWLAATTAMTGPMWVPYTLMNIYKNGLWAALKNPSPETAAAPTGLRRRLMSAHANAIENLGLYAAVVLVAVLAHRTSPLTAMAASAYFFARLVHYVVYSAGIPVVRTLAFAAGRAACLTILLVIFGLL
jgi:uncharacterized MAPEG superfamily protein